MLLLGGPERGRSGVLVRGLPIPEKLENNALGLSWSEKSIPKDYVLVGLAPGDVISDAYEVTQLRLEHGVLKST